MAAMVMTFGTEGRFTGFKDGFSGIPPVTRARALPGQRPATAGPPRRGLSRRRPWQGALGKQAAGGMSCTCAAAAPATGTRLDGTCPILGAATWAASSAYDG